MKFWKIIERFLRSTTLAFVVFGINDAAFHVHGKALTAGLVNLFLVMLAAFHWGFLETMITALAAAASLDYFYMTPIFSLYERDPQDWISSGIFLAIALTAGKIAERIKAAAHQLRNEQQRMKRLYQASRDIVGLARLSNVGEYLTQLILDTFQLKAVSLWDMRESRLCRSGQSTLTNNELRDISSGKIIEDSVEKGTFGRTLQIGSTSIGAIHLESQQDAHILDTHTIDAIASLASLALERAYSLNTESSAEAAKKSEQLRSSILDGLAHAFKTPLATIQSASSGLLEINRLSHAEQELVSLIDEEVSRLARLTNQILQTAGLDQKQIQICPELIHVYEFLNMCQREANALTGGDRLQIINETGGDLLWADPSLLQMALTQFLDNASKYATPASPIVFRATCHNGEAIFSITNEGSSISDEDKTRIFDRFYRCPDSKHKASGTGIGLSIARQIAHAHQGRTWVISDDQTRKTSFFLALPQPSEAKRNG